MSNNYNPTSRSTRKRPPISSSSTSTSVAPDSLAKPRPTKPSVISTNGAARKIKPDPFNIDFLLTNPKSKLVNANLKDIINHNTFLRLPEEDRRFLLTLLPDIDKMFIPKAKAKANGTSIKNMHDNADPRYNTLQPTQPMVNAMNLDGEDRSHMAHANEDTAHGKLDQEPNEMDIDHARSTGRANGIGDDAHTMDDAHQENEEATIEEWTIPEQFFRYNSFFHDCMDTFQESLHAGHLTHEYAEQRREAEEERRRGERKGAEDAWKDDNFEECWGEKGREKMHAVAGDSKTISLKDMCKYSLIRKEDTLVYKRNFSVVNILVDVPMKVIAASAASGMTIGIGKDVFRDLETPTSLETKILDHVGTVPRDKRPNGNAFKSLKLFREGEDLGRLFDIRKDYFEGKN